MKTVKAGRLCFLLLYFVPVTFLFAQPSEQDCSGAIWVCGDTSFSSYSGEGFIYDEIDSSSCLIGGEYNSVWIKFVVIDSGILEFEIVPPAINDDYDWALYDFTSNSCEDVLDSLGFQLRCNYSATPGATGCDTSSTQISVPQGGPNQCAPVQALPGQKFLMVVNNFATTTAGFQLIFSGTTTLASCNFTGTSDISLETVLNIYPNPSPGSFKIKLPSFSSNGILELLNIFGQNVYEQKISNPDGSSELSVQLNPAVENGLYVIRFELPGKQCFFGHLIIQQ